MIPTIQFDPATLAIWTTVGTLSKEVADLAATVMAAAAIGDDLLPIVNALPERDPLRRRVLWLASCVSHEKRHFFDVCLTNYGARRFRDLFVLAANAMPLIAEAKGRGEPVWFPIEVYSCPVSRDIFGISEPPANITKVAGLARRIKRFTGLLDASVEHSDGVIHLGGQAQLEGLAQASQMHAIEYHFGLDDLIAVTAEHVHHLPREGPYRTIEAVAGALGCTRETAGGAIGANVGLASALFVTAMSGRFFGNGPEVDASLALPWSRLARLIEALGPSPGNFEMSDEAAWDLVDNAARRLWGRTAVEEIEADIDAMKEVRASVFQDWLEESGMTDAWVDFIALRRRLLTEVLAAGSASLSPRAFPLQWLDRLFPWHIVATPGGDYNEGGAPVVFGRKFNPPSGLERFVPRSVAWGRLHEAPLDRVTAGFALNNREAWLLMLERHGPMAHLMLNGRRHRLMVPPALERPIEEISDFGVAVRFDPDYEWPEDRDPAIRAAEALELADWAGRPTFKCDITGDEIAAAEAALLTPWEFRRSPLMPRFREVFGSAEFLADIRLAADWSDWVVRRDLLPD